ncbi:MAG: hypothetical protein E6G27_10845 [Actinobacteria bacterium]|nr:MAG: hypothetical protein E6G27_10845 [Actinomycetota bacterium]
MRQLQFSQYAAPCVAAYSGNNGGSNGVRGITGDTITIAVRATSDASGPNAQALDKLNQQAGNPSNAEQRQILDALVPYFNKNFELFGRQVKLVDFNGQGNGTSEAQSQGQDAACADADAIASSVKAFGVIELPASNSMYVSQPFAECAKRYGLYLPLGAPYFPELWYQRWDPYVWAGTHLSASASPTTWPNTSASAWPTAPPSGRATRPTRWRTASSPPTSPTTTATSAA